MTEAERKLVADLTREAGQPLTACEVRLALAQAAAIEGLGDSFFLQSPRRLNLQAPIPEQ
jgi:hypothetical protein